MRRRYLVPGVLALCALPTAGRAGYIDLTTLLSENFDELTPTLGTTSVGAFHTINGTNVDIVGGNLFGNLCVGSESGNCIDLNGTGGNPQGVVRSNIAFSLVPGLIYSLFYTLNGSQRGNTASATAFLGDPSNGFTFTVPSGEAHGNVSSTFTVTAPETVFLTFAANQGGDVGPLLDNVRLISYRGAVLPEPATLSLFAVGFLGLALRRKALRTS